MSSNVEEMHDPKARRMAQITTPTDLTAAAAKDVAAALTDLRLVLAERLEIRTDDQAERLYDQLLTSPASDLDEAPGGQLDPATRRYLVAVYGALSWLQESLVEALLADLRAPGGAHDTPPGRPPAGERPTSG